MTGNDPRNIGAEEVKSKVCTKKCTIVSIVTAVVVLVVVIVAIVLLIPGNGRILSEDPECRHGEHYDEGDKVCKCGMKPSCAGSNLPYCVDASCKGQCGENFFTCKINGTNDCLDEAYVCDGDWDCDEGEDENIALHPNNQLCKSLATTCNYEQFQCQNKQCVAEDKHCDGKVDCNDASDELDGDCDLGGYPSFRKIDCNEKGFTKYELCYHVDYPNDGFDDDLLLNRKWEDNEWSFDGYLNKEKDTKLAVLLPDPDDEFDEDRKHTIISFKSSHVGSCSKFKVLSTNGETECMKIKDPHDDHLPGDSVNAQAAMSGNSYGNALRKDLDAKGYKLIVTVFYDNEYKKQLGSRARSHIQNAMGQVEQMYNEFKKWNTMMEIEVKAIKHISESWVKDSGGRFFDRWQDKLKPHARRERTSNTYVFVTRETSPGTRDYAGWGYVGQVCNSDHSWRINLNRGSKRVMSFALTVAHEIGHNLGMPHDCTPTTCSGKNYATLHGKKCVGYMDYDFSTHGWSYCNIYHTKTYLARNNCLEPRNGGGSSEGTCPKAHPYAYRSGTHCCEHATDKSGNRITMESQSCKNDAYQRCPKSKCKHFKDPGQTGNVNCGHHRAPRCEDCTIGHQRTWCAGDCSWNDDTNKCVKGGSSGCKDKAKASSCKYWKDKNWCSGSQYSPWLKDNCKKTCGQC